mgnify:CR=1 FL=1
MREIIVLQAGRLIGNIQPFKKWLSNQREHAPQVIIATEDQNTKLKACENLVFIRAVEDRGVIQIISRDVLSAHRFKLLEAFTKYGKGDFNAFKLGRLKGNRVMASEIAKGILEEGAKAAGKLHNAGRGFRSSL